MQFKISHYGNKTKKSNKSCTKYPTHMQHKITQSTIVYTNVTTNISYRALNQIQQFHINHFHVIINTSWLNLKETVLNFVCRAKHWDFCETKLTVSPGTSLQVNCYIAGNSLNLAATAVVVNIVGISALLPSDVIDFAMLPTLRFWQETVLLLDVMTLKWPMRSCNVGKKFPAI